MLRVLVYWSCLDALFLRKTLEDTDSDTTNFFQIQFL